MNGFYSYPSRPIVGFVVLLATFFYSNTSFSQSFEALAACDSLGADETYIVEITGLNSTDTVDIIVEGDTTTSVTGNTTFTSNSIAFVDGLQTVEVIIIEDPSGAAIETTIIVHEALCIDADGDGDIDFNEVSCDYRQAGPDFGTIVSTVAPYNGENVYLYFLTDSSGVLTLSLIHI